MFINTGGLPEQHRHHGGKLHLQLQRHHHHGHGHLQQFGQLHLPRRSRRLAARRHLLLPDPRHRGRLSAAALLLKPPPYIPPPRRPPSSPVTPTHPSSSLFPLSETTRLTMDGLHNLLRPPQSNAKKQTPT